MQLNERVVLIRVIIGDDVFTHYIDQDSFTFGRSDEADINLNLEGVSRKHAKVIIDEHKIFVVDMGSRYGTFLQGERLTANEKVEYEKSAQLFFSSPKAVVTLEVVPNFNNQEYIEWQEKSKSPLKLQILGAINRLASGNDQDEEKDKDFPIQRANNEKHSSKSLERSNQRELTYAAKAIMLTTDIYKLNEIREQKKQKVSELDLQIETTESNIASLEATKLDLSKKVDFLETNRSNGRLALDKLKGNFQSTKEKYTNKIAEYKSVLEAIKTEFTGFKNARDNVVEEKNAAEFRLKELVGLESESKNTINELKSKIDPLLLEISRAKNLKKDGSEKLAALEKEIDSLYEEKDTAEDKLSLLSDQIKYSRSSLERQRAESDALNTSAGKAIKERIEAETTRDKLLSEIASHAKESKDESKKLNELVSKRARLEGEVEKLDGRQLELSMKTKNLADKLKSQQGSLKDAKSEKESLEKKLIDLGDEIDKANKKRAQAKLFVAEALKEKEGLHDHFVAKRKQKQELEDILFASQEDLTKINTEVEVLNAEQASLANDISAQNVELEQAQKKLRFADNKLEERSSEFEALKEKKNTLETEIEERKTEILSKSSESDELSRSIDSLKIKISSLESDKTQVAKDLRPLEVQLELLKEEKAELLANITIQERELGAVTAKAGQSAGLLSKLERDIDEQTTVKKKLKSDIDELVSSEKTLTRDKANLTEAIEGLKDSQARLREKELEQNKRCDLLEQKLKDLEFDHNRAEAKLEILKDKTQILEDQYENIQNEFGNKSTSLKEIVAKTEALEEEFKVKQVNLFEDHKKQEEDFKIGFEEKRDNLETQYDLKTKELTQMNLEKEQLGKELFNLRALNEDIENEISSSEDTRNKIREEAARLEGELKQKAIHAGAELEKELSEKAQAQYQSDKEKLEQAIVLTKEAKELADQEYERKRESLDEDFVAYEASYVSRKEAMEQELNLTKVSLEEKIEAEQVKLNESLEGFTKNLEERKQQQEKDLEKNLAELDHKFKSEEYLLSSQFRDAKRKLEKDMYNHKHEYFMRFEFEMEQYLANKPKAIKEKGPEIIDLVSRSFGLANEADEKTLTDFALVPRVNAGKKMLQHYAPRLGIAVVVLSLFLMRGEIITGFTAMLPDDSGPSSSDVFVESVRRQIASKPKFEAELRYSYQDTYTENVLHYQKYLESFASEDFQKERVKKLRDYFFETLKISENAIVPFISEEKILINNLMDIKQNINPKFVKEGKIRMKKRELESRKKLIKTLEGIGNYNKFRVFDKKFF